MLAASRASPDHQRVQEAVATEAPTLGWFQDTIADWPLWDKAVRTALGVMATGNNLL